MTKKEIQELPDVEYKLTDEEGILLGDLKLLSIVDDPAIGENYKMFSAHKFSNKDYQFAAINQDQRLLIGPAMVVNKRIPRLETKNVPVKHNAWFSEDTVRMCSEIFLKNSNHTQTNLNHGEVAKADQIRGCYVSQSWIVNSPQNDTACSYGFSPQKGDWYVALKVESTKMWNFLKESGAFNGFSIEGEFTEKFYSVIRKKEDDLKTKLGSILYNPFISDEEKELQIRKLL